MTGNFIKIIINVLAMFLISYYAKRRDSKVTEEAAAGGAGSAYDIKMPGMLIGLCYTYVIIGLVFLTFMVIASNFTDTVTNGHYYIGAAFVAIGVVGFIFCKNWKVSVSEDSIVYTSVFGITKEYAKTEIKEVYVGKKREMVIKFDKGKVTVDPATVNHSRLFNELVVDNSPYKLDLRGFDELLEEVSRDKSDNEHSIDYQDTDYVLHNHEELVKTFCDEHKVENIEIPGAIEYMAEALSDIHGKEFDEIKMEFYGIAAFFLHLLLKIPCLEIMDYENSYRDNYWYQLEFRQT